jgi:hypothetical protein
MAAFMSETVLLNCDTAVSKMADYGQVGRVLIPSMEARARLGKCPG